MCVYVLTLKTINPNHTRIEGERESEGEREAKQGVRRKICNIFFTLKFNETLNGAADLVHTEVYGTLQKKMHKIGHNQADF